MPVLSTCRGARAGDECQIEFAGARDCNFLLPTQTLVCGETELVVEALQKTIIDAAVKAVLPGILPADNCCVTSAGVGDGNFLVPLMQDTDNVRG